MRPQGRAPRPVAVTVFAAAVFVFVMGPCTGQCRLRLLFASRLVCRLMGGVAGSFLCYCPAQVSVSRSLSTRALPHVPLSPPSSPVARTCFDSRGLTDDGRELLFPAEDAIAGVHAGRSGRRREDCGGHLVAIDAFRFPLSVLFLQFIHINAQPRAPKSHSDSSFTQTTHSSVHPSPLLRDSFLTSSKTK